MPMVRTIARIGLGAALAVAGAAAWAQAPAEFVDKNDVMTVSGIKGWSMQDGHDGTYKFSFTGKSLKGVWKKRAMTVVTSRIDGIAHAIKNGAMELTTAEMTGGVRATAERPSSKKSSNIPQTLVLTGNRARYVADSSRLDLTGGVSVVNRDVGAGRNMKMTGLTADVVLSRVEQNRDAVNSSELTGPIGFELDTVDVDAKGITHVAHVSGAAGKLHYLLTGEEGRALTLTGDVVLTRTEHGESGGATVEGSQNTEEFKGTSATIDIGPDPANPDQQTITSAKVDGPVTFTFEGYERQKHKGAADTWEKQLMQGQADTLTYRVLDPASPEAREGAYSVLTLQGNVRIKGTVMHVKVHGMNTATFWRDMSGKVIKAEGDGGPGILTIKPPSGTAKGPAKGDRE